jgi:SRSO17 transposase
MNFNLQKKDLYLAASILNWIHMQYAMHFSSKTRNVIGQSRQYMQGILLGKGRGNICRYAKSVPDCNNQTLHHFISKSPWDERAVIDHIQSDITKLVGDAVDGSIHIDESGFPKQGNNSVGTKRQNHDGTEESPGLSMIAEQWIEINSRKMNHYPRRN